MSDRDKLLDKDKRAPAAETERTVNLDNRGVIQMQQDVMTGKTALDFLASDYRLPSDSPLRRLHI